MRHFTQATFALSTAALISGCTSQPAKTSAVPAAVTQCVACHSFDENGPRRTGPNLHGVVGRKAASQPGFTYSGALKNSGLIWTPEALDTFLTAPARMVPGTRMGFTGEADPARRKEIIAYMQGSAK